MTPDQEAADAKKWKSLKQPSHADVLKLKASSKTDDIADLGLPTQEIEAATIAAIIHETDRGLSLEVANEEAEKAKTPDPIKAQRTELEEMVKSAAWKTSRLRTFGGTEKL